MKVLIACEFSAVVRDEFDKLGHEAYSCDLLPSEKPGKHIQDDVLKHLEEDWDLMIAHPDCKYMINSGVSWLHKEENRWEELAAATSFFNALKNAPIPKICIENPIPHKYAKNDIGNYTQMIQPWQFGEDASKATCLWLKNLPKLIPTNIIKKKLYANQTESGQNKLGPSENRWKERSRTFQGIADAMANQWGTLTGQQTLENWVPS